LKEVIPISKEESWLDKDKDRLSSARNPSEDSEKFLPVA
jgi:hypothetical protein